MAKKWIGGTIAATVLLGSAVTALPCEAKYRIEDGEIVLDSPFELAIGRAPSASPGTWHVADKWMSKAHFRVSAGEDGVPVLEDLDSLNGTSVNDRPLAGRRILRRGDAIAAGHSVFVFF